MQLLSTRVLLCQERWAGGLGAGKFTLLLVHVFTSVVLIICFCSTIVQRMLR